MKIRTNLLVSFGIIIAIITVFGLLFNSVEITLKNKYKVTINNIILEYNVTSLTKQLVTIYGQLLPDINNSELNGIYNSKVNELDGITESLSDSITFDDSRVIYTRLQNRVGLLKEYLATGIKNTKASDFTRSAETLEQINRASSDINDDTISMLLSDIAHSQDQQKNIQFVERLFLTIGSMVLLVVLLGSFMLAAFFSRRISGPLVKLSSISKQISEGNMELTVDDSILKREDEIGILAGSFGIMVKNLKQKIVELGNYNGEIEKSKKVIEENNKDLEKVNKLMVDRELAMIKLKKKVALLKESFVVGAEIEQKLSKIDEEA